MHPFLDFAKFSFKKAYSVPTFPPAFFFLIFVFLKFLPTLSVLWLFNFSCLCLTWDLLVFGIVLITSVIACLYVSSGFLSCKIPLCGLAQTLKIAGSPEETEGVVCVHKDAQLRASLWY